MNKLRAAGLEVWAAHPRPPASVRLVFRGKINVHYVPSAARCGVLAPVFRGKLEMLAENMHVKRLCSVARQKPGEFIPAATVRERSIPTGSRRARGALAFQ